MITYYRNEYLDGARVDHNWHLWIRNVYVHIAMDWHTIYVCWNYFPELGKLKRGVEKKLKK